MRACFVVHRAAWSGAARAFADGAALLAARGCETCFVAPAGSEAERSLVAAGHTVVGVSTRGGWVRAAWRLRRVIASRLTEVVFVHDDREHLSAAAAVRLAGRGAVVRRTPAGERLALGRDGRLAMRFAATGFVFAHADDMRGHEPPRNALAAQVAPPGAPVVALTSRHAAVGTIRPGGERLVIAAGADRRREALVALRALALLAPRRPALRASFLAPADDVTSARVEAAALGVADRIDWVADPVPRPDALVDATLVWVIAAADDAVFAILDAFAHGVPVLAERAQLTARFVEDGVSGVLRRRGEAAEWASVIASVLSSVESLTALRAGARQAASGWPLEAAAGSWVHAMQAARDRTRWIA